MDERALHLGLNEFWWVRWRDHKPVRPALQRAFRDHWAPILEQRLLENQQNNKTPTNWNELAQALRREYANVWRWRNGKQAMRVTDLVALGTILEVDFRELLPPNLPCLAAATQYVSKRKITPERAQAYAEFRLTSKPNHSAPRPIRETAKILGMELLPLYERDDR